MKTIHVELGKESYDIQIENGLLDRLGAAVRTITGAQRIAVITDDTVDALYGDRMEKSLEKAGLVCRRIAIPAGEQSKNLTVLSDVYDQMSAFGMTRSDAVVTFGGGVPGDLGGFAAATYLRGIPFIQVPTTILAQVDSSVGGKVAVDLPSGKNLVGNFYQPLAVFIDPELLHSLPMRFQHDGLAEAIKYGCIRDAELFSLFERMRGDADIPAHIEQIIYRCCSIKAVVVAHDEKDTGERMILNFGHTLGHAIEKLYGYGTYTHGEAVAAGMVMLTRQTEVLGLTEAGTAERISNVLQKFSLPVRIKASTEALLPQIGHDKKKRGNSITLIILDRLGECRLLPLASADLAQYVRGGDSQ